MAKHSVFTGLSLYIFMTPSLFPKRFPKCPHISKGNDSESSAIHAFASLWMCGLR
jgi:hypothetical protein